MVDESKDESKESKESVSVCESELKIRKRGYGGVELAGQNSNDISCGLDKMIRTRNL